MRHDLRRLSSYAHMLVSSYACTLIRLSACVPKNPNAHTLIRSYACKRISLLGHEPIGLYTYVTIGS